MKTLLIATDFSAGATHAAEYGYQLARKLMANIVLCNAINVPAEVPQAGMIVWPVEEYDLLKHDSDQELKLLKHALEDADHGGFHPSVNCMNCPGTVTSVINDIVETHKIDLIIMGTHVSGGLSQLLLGNHAENMIDAAKAPVLLIPPGAAVSDCTKIAFATDFKQPARDLENIYALIPMAKFLNAEILIAHVNREHIPQPEFEKVNKDFFTQISNKANYSRIYYTILNEGRTENGLDWLCKHEQIGMLAMVHRSRSFISSLLTGSHTKKMARHIGIPLLVIPEN